MYFVRSLERWQETEKPFDDQEEAEQHALQESWSDTGIGLFEGDSWADAELTAIAFGGEMFTKLGG